MKLNEIADNPGASQSPMRVGRGIGSGKGKTCGRGVKGQKARTGVAIKGFEGGQMPLHRRLPKRGFRNPFTINYNEVNLGRIQAAVDAGKLDPAASVTIESLIAAGVCGKPRDGVKILGKGALAARLAFEVAAASKSAVAAIEGAGGSIVLLRVISRGGGSRGLSLPPDRASALFTPCAFALCV
jgi:large subunit ribosomal protein L15